MKVVIQRSKNSSVTIENKIYGEMDIPEDFSGR